MTAEWQPVRQELRRWRAAGLTLPLWWRDDDAVSDTGALRQLLTLGDGLGLPVHLAVIPKYADHTLAERCQAHPATRVLVHGWAHQNHAPAGSKKAEFGQNRPHAAAEAQEGLHRLTTVFGQTLLPVFVPPWNRIDPLVILALPDLGYRAVSTYTPRAAPQAAPHLARINTHIDPIDWRGGGGLVQIDMLLGHLCKTLQDRRLGQTDNTEPLGLLTHHLVHDADIWEFTRRCIHELLEGGAQACDLNDHLA